jgi:hypothetical protein
MQYHFSSRITNHLPVIDATRLQQDVSGLDAILQNKVDRSAMNAVRSTSLFAFV